MNWTFDLDAAAFYFKVAGADSVSQRELARGLIVDLDERGSVTGVEILHGADVAGGLGSLVDLVGRELASSIVFVTTHPPVPRAVPAHGAKRAVSSPPEQSGARSFELTTV